MFDIGISDQPRSCFTWRGAFAAASFPPASPCGDTDGYIEECRSPTCAHCLRALARLPWAWSSGPVPALMATTMAKSSARMDSTSVAARCRASARTSPPLLFGQKAVRPGAPPPRAAAVAGRSEVARGDRCVAEAPHESPKASKTLPRDTREACRRETRRRRKPPVCRHPASGANRDRTGDILLAKQALSQLSYGPGAPECTREASGRRMPVSKSKPAAGAARATAAPAGGGRTRRSAVAVGGLLGDVLGRARPIDPASSRRADL